LPDGATIGHPHKKDGKEGNHYAHCNGKDKFWRNIPRMEETRYSEGYGSKATED
jgi:hypothetical protein